MILVIVLVHAVASGELEVREVLELVRSMVKPGATTLDLERAAEAKLAELGAHKALSADPSLAKGLMVRDGELTNRTVAQALGM